MIREPPVEASLDLRDFEYMPLDVVRLRDSDVAILSSGDAFRAAVLLWCSAWHQVPCSSLPIDEPNLARYAGYGRDVKGWLKVKTQALRGFVECADGRLYHLVIAEKAIEADAKRNAYRLRTAKATESRRKTQEDRDRQRNDQRNVPQNEERSDHQGKVSVSLVRGEERASAGESGILTEDFDLADALIGILRVDPAEPGWQGIPYRAVVWRKTGWPKSMILGEATTIMKSRPDTPHIHYFEKAFANAFAKLNAPAPVGTAVERPRAASGNIIPAQDQIRDRLRALDERPGEVRSDLCGGSGEAPVRMLPERRRE